MGLGARGSRLGAAEGPKARGKGPKARGCEKLAPHMRKLLVISLLLVACTSTEGTTTVGSGTEPSIDTTTSPSVTTSTTEPEATTTTVVPVLGDGVAGLELADVVFGASRAERFRATTEIVSAADEDEQEIVFASFLQAAYQREPAGVEISVQTSGAGGGDVDIDIVAVDASYWVREAGGDWKQDPAAAQLLSLASVSLLSPSALDVVLPVLDEVGEEEVAGRPALHVQGGVQALEVFMAATGVQDLNAFRDLEYASIDLWIDFAGFVSKAEYRFGGVKAATLEPEYYRASFELAGFDEDFTISPPD